MLDAVCSGQKRIGLVMAVSTGRTLVLAHVVWKLIQSNTKRRALLLGERADVLHGLSHLLKRFGNELIWVDHPGRFIQGARLHLCTMQRLVQQLVEGNEADKPPPDLYDLVITHDVRQGGHANQVARFATATIIKLAHASPPADAEMVYQYTLADALVAEQVQPPPGFRSARLGDIAEVRTGWHTQMAQGVGGAVRRVALLSARDLAGAHLDLSLLDRLEADVSDDFVAREGDILISKMFVPGSPRMLLVGSLPSFPVVPAHTVLVIRADRAKAAPSEVFAFLSSIVGARAIGRYTSSMAGAFRLSVASLAELLVFLPLNGSAKEQTDGLSSVSRVIRQLKEKILPELENIERQATPGAARSDLAPIAEMVKQLIPELAPPGLSEQVTMGYPAPLAIPYRRFAEARFNAHEQLLRLRDVSEAGILFVYHVVLADWLRNLDRQRFRVEDAGARRAYNGYSMATRLDFVEAVLQSDNHVRDMLFMPELRSVDLVPPARKLHQLRNELSHTQTTHESRQLRTIREYMPVLEEFLSGLAFLVAYRLIRIPYFYYKDGRVVQAMEIYRGVAKEFDEVPLAADAKPIRAESDHLVLLSPDDDVLDLHPFYQLIASEETQYEPHLCFLKQRKEKAQRLEGASVNSVLDMALDGFATLDILLKDAD